MKAKKLISAILCIAMVLSTMGFTVFAEDGASEPVVPADFEIATVDELLKFAAAANEGDTFESKTVALTNNIDMTGVEWTPISSFSGTFNGQDYTISNLTNAAGLFNTITAEGTVKNLKLDEVNADFAANVGYGFIAVNMQGNATNCHVSNVTVNRAGWSNANGGTLFKSVSGDAVVYGCSASNVTVHHTGKDSVDGLGGVFGGATGDAVIEKCTGSNIKLTFEGKGKRVGGFIAGVDGTATVKDCTLIGCTIGEYESEGYPQEVGGFAATVSGGTLTNCSVEAVTIESQRLSKQTGGFVGQVHGGSFDTCTASDVTMNINARGSNEIGSTAGFCGQTNSDTDKSFDNCSVTGLDMKLTGGLEDTIGGFITSTGGNGGVTITDCSVEGAIDAEETSENGAVGGFIGNLGWGGSAAVAINQSSADVDITANGPASGFVAKASSNTGTSVSTLEVTESTATGDVTSATGAAGGFVAVGDRGTYEGCKANGAVSGDTAGGFWGEITPNTSAAEDKTISIKSSTASGEVIGTTVASGFVGTITTAEDDETEGIKNVTEVKLDNITASSTVAGTTEDTKVNDVAETVAPENAVAQIGYTPYDNLAGAFAAAEAGNTITLLDNVDLTGWTSVDVKKAITLDGNGKTITGLTAPLINYASAKLEIKDLTVSGANIQIIDPNGSDAGSSAAALVQWLTSGDELKFSNVTVKDSTIKGDGYVAALIGFAQASDTASIAVNGGAIENVALVAGGTVGTVIGHTYVDVTVSDLTVSGNSLTSNSDGGERPDKVGLVVGRVNAKTASVSANVDDTNSATPASDINQHRVVGSLPGGTALISGGSYPTDPTVTAKEGQKAAVDTGRGIVEEDGKFVIVGIKGNVTKTHYSKNDNSIKATVSGAYPSKSVVLELYSNEDKIATTTLASTEYFVNAATELTASFDINPTEGGDWETVWEKGNPVDSAKPTKVVLYIDGAKVAENAVTLYPNMEFEYGGQPEADWTKLEGVKVSRRMKLLVLDEEGKEVDEVLAGEKVTVKVILEGENLNGSEYMIFYDTSKFTCADGITDDEGAEVGLVGKENALKNGAVYDPVANIGEWEFVAKSVPYSDTAITTAFEWITAKAWTYKEGYASVKFDAVTEEPKVVTFKFYEYDLAFKVDGETQTENTKTVEFLDEGHSVELVTDPALTPENGLVVKIEKDGEEYTGDLNNLKDLGTYVITFTTENAADGYKNINETFTLTIDDPERFVEVNLTGGYMSEYTVGKKLVLVHTNETGVAFTYDGIPMIDVTEAGYEYYETERYYDSVYAIVVDKISDNLADYEAKVDAVPLTGDVKKIEKYDENINQYSRNDEGKVDGTDVTSIYGVLNQTNIKIDNLFDVSYAEKPIMFIENMMIALKSDTNKDKKVDPTDTDPVVTKAFNK